MSECHVSQYYIDREALIEQLEQNRANAIKCLWRCGAHDSYLREQIPGKVSLLELAIKELKDENKDRSEVMSYFEQLVQEELKALNNSLGFREEMLEKQLNFKKRGKQ